MILKISKIIDAGNLEAERVTLLAVEDGDIGLHLIFKTKKIGDTTVSSLIGDVYWFVDKEIKKGDTVVLYSKKGVNNDRKNEDGTSSYFFYWNKDGAMWTDPKDSVVLSEIARWSYKSVEGDK